MKRRKKITRRDIDNSFKRYAYLPRTKLSYTTLQKLRSLKSKHVGQKGWADFIDFLTRDVTMEPTMQELIAEGTGRTLLPVWMRSFAENLPYIRYGDGIQVSTPEDYYQRTFADLVEHDPIVEGEPDFESNPGEIQTTNGHQEQRLQLRGQLKIKNPPKSSAVVVGRGPSLFRNKHCEMLADAKSHGYNGLVVASDGGMIPLLEAGVVPDVVVTVDGAPVIRKFFEHPLVEKHASEMKWIVSVTVDHSVYQAARKIGLPIYWFMPMFDDWRTNESWTRLQTLMTVTDKFTRGVPRAQAGGNAGAFAWVASMSIYKRSPVALIGMDLGYPADTKLEDTQYYSSVLRIAKGNVGLIERSYRHFHHPVWNKDAYVDNIFYHYRQAFLEMQLETPTWYRLYGGTVNCTEGGTLLGEGITCMTFKEFLEKM